MKRDLRVAPQDWGLSPLLWRRTGGIPGAPTCCLLDAHMGCTVTHVGIQDATHRLHTSKLCMPHGLSSTRSGTLSPIQLTTLAGSPRGVVEADSATTVLDQRLTSVAQLLCNVPSSGASPSGEAITPLQLIRNKMSVRPRIQPTPSSMAILLRACLSQLLRLR